MPDFHYTDGIRMKKQEPRKKMKLPDRYVTEMTDLLGAEAGDFFASYRQPPAVGLRANGLKLPPAALRERAPFRLAPVPWAPEGFYADGDERPGRHPYHFLGLYYIQEPSAMLPAELLDAAPGDRVLDLCAAPGGKATQLAPRLRGKGLLVVNDSAGERTKALAKNIERAGVRGAVVLNEQPARLAEAFGAFFDKVLVDAPCSGEGMFRKDPDMARAWERHSAERSARMQDGILRDAARLVRPGGRLVYSTCTFNPRENEGTVARFLAAHPEFEAEPPDGPLPACFAPGRPDWLTPEEAAGLAPERQRSLAAAVRIWPHRCRGEGHFAVRLVRRPAEGLSEGGDADTAGSIIGRPDKAAGRRGRKPESAKAGTDAEADALRKFAAFLRESLPGWQPQSELVARGGHLYKQPPGLPPLDGLRVVRPGLHLGFAGRHRFEPSQALAMALSCDQAALSLRLSSGEADSERYLKGETLQPDPDRLRAPDGSTARGTGWTLVCIDGFPAGWGRWDGRLLKNELLPGWRLI